MPPPSHVQDKIIPPNQITTEAVYGFLTGASRFLAISIPTHLALTHIHPVYRNLTPQFKVFLQIASLTLGGYIWAERRVGEYNEVLRRKHRALERSKRAWSEDEEVKARVREMLIEEERQAAAVRGRQMGVVAAAAEEEEEEEKRKKGK